MNFTQENILQLQCDKNHNVQENDSNCDVKCADKDLLEFLDAITKCEEPDGQNDPVNEPVIKQEKPLVKCEFCPSIFEPEEFHKHVCDFNEHGNVNVQSDKRLNDSELKQTIQELEQLEGVVVSDLIKDGTIGIEVSTKPAQPGFACDMCDKKFVHASGLARHEARHNLNLIPAKPVNKKVENEFYITYTCNFCLQLFLDHDEAISHGLSHQNFINDLNARHEDSITEMELNYLIKMTEKLLLTPSEEVEDTLLQMGVLNEPYQCEFCENLFFKSEALLLHEGDHNLLPGYVCFHCSGSFGNLKELLSHRRIFCPVFKERAKQYPSLKSVFVCNVCRYETFSLEKLYEHRYLNSHMFVRKYVETGNFGTMCPECGQIEDKLPLCEKHFQDNHAKKTEQQSYRQYLCDVCGKTYTQSSHLWQHLRFHQGVKPFTCSYEGCGRKFTIRPDLNDHIRKCHTKERPFHCADCKKSFLTGSVYYQHRLIHRGERRYGCYDCGKRFYRADALKNHQRIHTGEKPYSCEFCPKNFRQRGDRDKHTRARHSDMAPFKKPKIILV